MIENKNMYLISYRSLRQMIGILGMILPFLCWGINALVNYMGLLNNPNFVNTDLSQTYIHGDNLKSSVSHYYYTASSPLFTGILITVAVFLFTYKGYKRDDANDRYSWITDRFLCTFAAICLLGIVTFPTGTHTAITDNFVIFVASDLVGNIHIWFAGGFFMSMALMSLVNFRRHPGKVFIKDNEGTVYLVCGCIMLAGILILCMYFVFDNSNSWLNGKFVFVNEVVMLCFFGIAWLVKGKSIPTAYLLRKMQSDTI
ncbi:MAG TPA: hypothetical protein PK047_11595 [Saprospiraceae bacterium]|jgi:hypothetical protein|nr:hypothetical protein [Saprospiraceae bacterium]HRO09503.1 hypothetical protein [Saprospiraceae bacterium]HRP42800.1 hypothetical protein [Saprospiraceae bacterium]